MSTYLPEQEYPRYYAQGENYEPRSFAYEQQVLGYRPNNGAPGTKLCIDVQAQELSQVSVQFGNLPVAAQIEKLADRYVVSAYVPQLSGTVQVWLVSDRSIEVGPFNIIDNHKRKRSDERQSPSKRPAVGYYPQYTYGFDSGPSRMYATPVSQRLPKSSPNLSLHSESSKPKTPMSRSSNNKNPLLQRTSTLPQTAGQTWDQYPSKAILVLDGSLNSMTMKWTPDEIESRRRIVRFWRAQRDNKVYAHFEPSPAETLPDGAICVSCIYWLERRQFFITSVDTIALLERLIGVVFGVEEKNRIRRNLEGFKPMTVSKTKDDSQEFFKVIMGFPNPKPRNIEKDVKVFPWEILEHALKKIVGKYSASWAANTEALETPEHSVFHNVLESGSEGDTDFASPLATPVRAEWGLPHVPQGMQMPMSQGMASSMASSLPHSMAPSMPQNIASGMPQLPQMPSPMHQMPQISQQISQSMPQTIPSQTHMPQMPMQNMPQQNMPQISQSMSQSLPEQTHMPHLPGNQMPPSSQSMPQSINVLHSIPQNIPQSIPHSMAPGWSSYQPTIREEYKYENVSQGHPPREEYSFDAVAQGAERLHNLHDLSQGVERVLSHERSTTSQPIYDRQQSVPSSVGYERQANPYDQRQVASYDRPQPQGPPPQQQQMHGTPQSLPPTPHLSLDRTSSHNIPLDRSQSLDPRHTHQLETHRREQ